MAVINFGSINIDHIYAVPHFVAPGETLSSTHYQSVLGGKGANQSIACARAGVDTKHVGAINQGDFEFVLPLKSSGVNCQFIQQLNDTATGHAIIQVNEQGENAIVLFAGANHRLSNEHINDVIESASENDWVLLQNETNAIAEIINSAAAKGLSIAFNPAPMTATIRNLPLEKISLLFVNEIEAMQLTETQTIDAAAQKLAVNYPNTKVIMTLGKAGVCYLYKGDKIKVPGFSVDAIDTTAAGDTFTGYFLANYIHALNKDETDIKQALIIACAAAALCVTKQGAAPSIPSAREVAHFVNDHNQKQ